MAQLPPTPGPHSSDPYSPGPHSPGPHSPGPSTPARARAGLPVDAPNGCTGQAI